MAKLKNGILGGFAGAVGNIVGSTWKGINVIRIKPDHVKNPNTPKQQAQRRRFKECTSFVRKLMIDFVEPIWNKEAHGMSGYNYMVKRNMPAFNSDGLIEGHDKIILSIGSLYKPDFKDEVKPENKDCHNFTWDYNEDMVNVSPDDKLNVAVIDCKDEGNNIFVLRTDAKRKDEKFIFDLATNASEFELCDCYIYLYFSNAENTKFSDSQGLPVTLGMLDQ